MDQTAKQIVDVVRAAKPDEAVGEVLAELAKFWVARDRDWSRLVEIEKSSISVEFQTTTNKHSERKRRDRADDLVRRKTVLRTTLGVE